MQPPEQLHPNLPDTDVPQRVIPRMKRLIGAMSTRHSLPELVVVLIADEVRGTRFMGYAQAWSSPAEINGNPTVAYHNRWIDGTVYELPREKFTLDSIIEEAQIRTANASFDVPFLCDKQTADEIAQGDGSFEFIQQDHYRLVGRVTQKPIEIFTEYQTTNLPLPDVPPDVKKFSIDD